jgi:hypothetical protein
MIFAAVALVAASMFATDNKDLVIKGKVKGDDGKAVTGAEIRVKALDRKAPDKVAVTDSQGQYIVNGLVAGRYSITAFDPDGIARSRAAINADRGGWARVDFDLALDSMVGDSANGVRQTIVISGHAFGSPR